MKFKLIDPDESLSEEEETLEVKAYCPESLTNL